MHSSLVPALVLSAMIAAGCALFAVLAGWGPILGFVVYSLSGSIALVAIACLQAWVAEAVKRPRISSPIGSVIARNG